MTLRLNTPLNVGVPFPVCYFPLSEYLLGLVHRILHHTCDILLPMNLMAATIHRFYARLQV